MLNDHDSTPSSSPGIVVLRGRHHVAFDTLVVEADLSEHQVVEAIREDHDVDQMVEWVRLAGHDTLVLHHATFIRVTALRDASAMRDLPVGAQACIDLLYGTSTNECLTHVVPIEALRGPSDQTRAKGRHPTRATLAPRTVSNDELLRRTKSSDARTRAAVAELVHTREAWPTARHSGSLLRASDAIRHDWSLGDARLILAKELEAIARRHPLT